MKNLLDLFKRRSEDSDNPGPSKAEIEVKKAAPSKRDMQISEAPAPVAQVEEPKSRVIAGPPVKSDAIPQPPIRGRNISISSKPVTTGTPQSEQKGVVIELGDFLRRIPPEFLKPGSHDERRELVFNMEEVARNIEQKRATVPLTRIVHLCPDIFREDQTGISGVEVYFPWQKLNTQLHILREFKARAMAGKNSSLAPAAPEPETPKAVTPTEAIEPAEQALEASAEAREVRPPKSAANLADAEATGTFRLQERGRTEAEIGQEGEKKDRGQVQATTRDHDAMATERDALKTELEKIRQQLDQFRSESETLRKQVAAVTAERNETVGAMKKLHDEVASQAAAASQRVAELEKNAETQIAALRVARDRVVQDHAAVVEDAAQAGKEFGEKFNEIQTSHAKERDALKDELERARQEREALPAQVAHLKQAADREPAPGSPGTGDLPSAPAAERAAQTEAVDVLNERLSDALRQRDEAVAVLSGMRRELSQKVEHARGEVRKEAESLRQQLDQLRSESDAFQKEI